MTVLEAIPDQLRGLKSWIDINGVQWYATASLDVRDLAYSMNGLRARFVTVTAVQLPKDEGICLEYLWDLDGKLHGFPFHLTADTFPSIYDLCEAVDWIEREIHEEYSVEFTGRLYEPLLLRQGNQTGVNLREESK